MRLFGFGRKGLRERAVEEGAVWARAPYYDDAEPHIAAQWHRHIWPMIHDCDFSCVLDLAAGHGRNSALLRQHAGQIIVVDVNRENVDFCRKRFAGDRAFRFLQNDGCSLRGVPDGSVSLVYSFDSMVHFDSDVVRAYLEEFRRVLRPGGRGFCHHSNYTGNPAGDFREDPGWRNFMSQALFHHYCARAGLSVVRSVVLDWSVPNHDCLTLFEKPNGPPRPRRHVPVSFRTYADPDRPTRRHLPVEALAEEAGAWGVEGWDGALVLRPPHYGVALDVLPWAVFGSQVTSARCRVGLPAEGPGRGVLCRLELHEGERGGGRLLGAAEGTLAPGGEAVLEAAAPPGSAPRSLVFSARAAGSGEGPAGVVRFRDVELAVEPGARVAMAG